MGPGEDRSAPQSLSGQSPRAPPPPCRDGCSRALFDALPQSRLACGPSLLEAVPQYDLVLEEASASTYGLARHRNVQFDRAAAT